MLTSSAALTMHPLFPSFLSLAVQPTMPRHIPLSADLAHHHRFLLAPIPPVFSWQGQVSVTRDGRRLGHFSRDLSAYSQATSRGHGGHSRRRRLHSRDTVPEACTAVLLRAPAHLHHPEARTTHIGRGLDMPAVGSATAGPTWPPSGLGQPPPEGAALRAKTATPHADQ